MEQGLQKDATQCSLKLPFVFVLLIVIIFVAYPDRVSAFTQNSDLKFEYLGNENGLSNLRITSILQDHSGYMWIGTVRGLFRYNGYEMKVYKSNPMEGNSLTYHQIECLFMDRDNELWIGTRYGGLNRYSREKDNFIKIDIPAEDVLSISQDKNGFLWIGTSMGLFRYIKEEDRFEAYHFRVPDGSSERLTLGIHCTDSETLVNIAELGILKYNSIENDFSPLLLIDDCKDFNVSEFTLVYPIDEDVFWLGTDQGLLRFEKGGRNELERLSDIHGTVIDSDINFIVEESYQHIWIGAEGVYRYDLMKNEFTHHIRHTDHPSNLASDAVSCGYKDIQGNIWIGTAGSGINIWHQAQSRFKEHSRINSTLNLFSRDITTVAQDEENNLWIGTRDKGVIVFDKNQAHLEQLNLQYPELQNLSQEFARIIVPGADKKIWIGSTTRKLTMIDPVNMDSYTIILNVDKEMAGERDMVTAIIPQGDSLLWIGTGSDGVHLFNINSRSFIHYEGRNQLSRFNIVDLEKDSRGNLWIATNKNGLLKMDPKGDIKRQEFDSIPFSILRNANIITIYEDTEENLWFGTEFLGLIRLSTDHQSAVFDISGNVINNEICDITEDRYERLWISTTKGLARFEKATNSVKHYSWRDGMTSDEFNYNASYYGKDNMIYLGGTNGLVSFKPETIRDNDFEPTVLIETLFIGNREMKIGQEDSILKKALYLTEKITLKHSQNDIGFEVAALNYISPEKNQYQYRLEGYGSSEWIPIGSRRRFDFTNLHYGNYMLHVKGSNNDKIWSGHVATLDIKILPPFWLSWWAYLTYLFLAAFTIIIIVRGVRQRIRFKNQIARQAFESQQQEELNNMKIQFFTNISHEFKIPLSLIISPIEEALKAFKGPSEHKNRLQLIKMNATRLLMLVTSLIDFRKAEQDVMKLKSEKADLVGLGKTIVDSYKYLGINEKKHIEFSCELPACIFEFDRAKMERVLYNLIDNAINHTAPQDEITVGIRPDVEQGIVILEVRDTGCGIPEDDLEKIFEKFYQSEKPPQATSGFLGSGIGLYLCRKITELHEGTIKVESSLGDGSSFIITLPAPDLVTTATEEEIMEYIPVSQGWNNLAPSGEEPPAILSENTPLVLIVEDHQELAGHIQKLLWDFYRTEKATNGKEGLEFTRELMPDLIISDIMMPEMDGIEMCKQIKGDPKLNHIPVILLSAKSDMDTRLEGFDMGADEFLEKPFQPQHLRSRVQNLIDNREKLRTQISKEAPRQPMKAGISHKDREFLEEVFQKIEQNMGNSEYNVNKLSDELGISRVQVYRKFNELTGISPKEYMKTQRLKAAAKLLKEGNDSISQVGYQVGFNSHSSFTVSFKAFYGVSPKEYKAG